MFVVRQRTHKDGGFHAAQDTTFPFISLEYALGGSLDGRLLRRYGSTCHFVLSGLCLVAMGLAYLLGQVFGTLAALVMGGLVMGLFMGAAAPGLGVLVGDIHPASRRTFAFASQIALTYLISSFAPPLLGALSEALQSLRWASASFAVGILLIGILILFSPRLVKRATPGSKNLTSEVPTGTP